MKLKDTLKATAKVLALGASCTASANALDDVKSRNTLVCGTLGTSEPFSFQDPKTRQVVGYEVDLCKEIADHLGVKLEIKLIAVAARLPELAGRRVAVVASNQGWSPARAQTIASRYQTPVLPPPPLISSTDAR